MSLRAAQLNHCWVWAPHKRKNIELCGAQTKKTDRTASLELDLLDQVDFGTIIQDFANRKCRKKFLLKFWMV
jgi:hypothetical protein